MTTTVKVSGHLKQHLQLQQIISDIKKIPELNTIKLQGEFVRYVVSLVYNNVKKLATTDNLNQLVFNVFTKVFDLTPDEITFLKNTIDDIINSGAFQKNSKIIKTLGKVASFLSPSVSSTSSTSSTATSIL